MKKVTNLVFTPCAITCDTRSMYMYFDNKILSNLIEKLPDEKNIY